MSLSVFIPPSLHPNPFLTYLQVWKGRKKSTKGNVSGNRHVVAARSRSSDFSHATIASLLVVPIGKEQEKNSADIIYLFSPLSLSPLN